MSGSIEQQIQVLEQEITTLQAEIDVDQAQLAADELQLQQLESMICFAHGTHILTERGEVAVENLKVGDHVVTPHGPAETMPIRWIGRQHFEGDAARFAQPVLVRAGALGDGLPLRDLWLSGDHCLHLEGRLVPVKLLVNGETIRAEKGLRQVDYVNIELDQHNVVLAEGAESETYLDCGNRGRFNNADEGSEWLASRPVRSSAAWHDGSAFAMPLWSGPEVVALRERLACLNEHDLAA